MPTIPLGLSGNVYYTTQARTTWAATPSANGFYQASTAPQSVGNLSIIRNVDLVLKDSEADGTVRSSGGWKYSMNALREASLEMEIPWQPSDSGFQALQTAYLGRQTIAMVALDGSIATSGSQGPWADWTIIEFPRSEPIEKEMLSKVVVKLGVPPVYPPQWVQIN